MPQSFLINQQYLNSSTNSPHCMKPEVLLPCSQQYVICIMSQMNQIHSHPSHFSNMRFNIVFRSTSRSSNWSLSFRFPHQNPACVFPPMLAVCPAHLGLPALIIIIMFVMELKSYNLSWRSLLHLQAHVSSSKPYLQTPSVYLHSSLTKKVLFINLVMVIKDRNM